MTGLALGSVKPYAFDCYLGLFGKSVLEESNTDSDPLIIAGVFAIILVGVLSTQLASSVYEELVAEQNRGVDTVEEGSIQEDIFNFVGGLIGISGPKTNLSQTGSSSDLANAWQRVSQVVDDEILCVGAEVKSRCEIEPNVVGWDGKLLYSGLLLNNSDAETYPGRRNLQSYEDGEDVETKSGLLYIFESLVFSIVVISKMATVNYERTVS